MSPPPRLHSQTTTPSNVSFYRPPEFYCCPFILVPSALAQACLPGFLAKCSNFLNSHAERKPHPSSSFKFHWLPEAPRGLSRILRPSTRLEVRGGPPPAHPGPKQGLRGRARWRSATWPWLQVLAKRTLFPQIGEERLGCVAQTLAGSVFYSLHLKRTGSEHGSHRQECAQPNAGSLSPFPNFHPAPSDPRSLG